MGATVTRAISARPVVAAWVANDEDDRFGRLVVQMQPPDGGEAFLAVSRTYFADSFYGATSLLWGGHYGSTGFHEGEILVVMSMDPFASPDPRAREAILREFRPRAAQLEEGDEEAARQLLVELQRALGRLPRRVVVHPALFGRELSWSAVRVDFSFNDVDGLGAEAQLANGGTAMPAEFKRIPIRQAGTWQFFERESEVGLRGGTPRIRNLTVRSSGPGSFEDSDRSHFSVSMFRLDPDAPEGAEPDRLPRLEARLQPMLDWLATNHHDFIRLNDFSESLSLLRWLKGIGIAPILLDLDGEHPEIATPDRIVIGEGPGIG